MIYISPRPCFFQTTYLFCVLGGKQQAGLTLQLFISLAAFPGNANGLPFPHTLHQNSPNTPHQNTNCYVAAGPCFINGLDQNSRSPQLPADSGETEFHSLGQDVVYTDTTFSSRFSSHRTAGYFRFPSSVKAPF